MYQSSLLGRTERLCLIRFPPYTRHTHTHTLLSYAQGQEEIAVFHSLIY